MSAIRCPYCQHLLELKGAKPGRFGPKCSQCHCKFLLIIPDEPNEPVIVQALQSELHKEHVPGSIDDALGLDHDEPIKPRRQQPTNSSSQTIAPSPPARQVPSHVSATMAPGEQERAPVGLEAPPADAPRTVYKDMSHSPADDLITGRLGGYEIVQKLGHGGMGSVYLARQVSLDRNVALKVLNPTLAQDPQFVARFTREAYAAAQLNHHHIVQIHDIGQDRSFNFFSMEFVEGDTLGNLVKLKGRMDSEQAVTYVLQAARGLKFAHEHGIIHRDVKPENLMLNDQGMVKVADLGLVKRLGSDDTQITGAGHTPSEHGATQLGISMGTPAYMPPEQAMDAAKVDQRADIYSLGCTFYDLLTGHPPFTGKTAVEVMTKHAKEPITPPDRVVKNISPVLSQVVMKMVAKRPEDRYQTMGEVVQSLEAYLGIDSAGTFKPRDEHVKVVQFASEAFAESSWAGTRRWLIRGFYALCVLAIAFCAWKGYPLVAGGIVGFAVLTTLIYQITVGVMDKTFLFAKARQLAFTASIVEWISYLAIAALLVMLLWTFGLLWVWLGFGVLAAIVAVGFHFVVDAAVTKDRSSFVRQTEGLIKQMRLKGLDENSVRQFVCHYSGENWEEFYESLFGYEAKIAARHAWGKSERGVDRTRHAVWRDRVINWIDNKVRARRDYQERRHLAKIEAQALAAKGITGKIGMKQAMKAADKLADKAAVIRSRAERRATDTAVGKAKEGRYTKGKVEIKIVQPGWVEDEHAEVESDEEFDRRRRRKQGYIGRRYGGPLDILFGQGTRLLLAIILLAGFAKWWNQNGGQRMVKEASDILATSTDPTEIAKRQNIESVKEATKDFNKQVAASNIPLRVKAVPDWLCDAVGSWKGGLAGALLLLSVFFAGKLVGLSVMLAAAIALLGDHSSVPVLGTRTLIAAVVAVIVWLLGIMFFRETEGF